MKFREIHEIENEIAKLAGKLDQGGTFRDEFGNILKIQGIGYGPMPVHVRVAEGEIIWNVRYKDDQFSGITATRGTGKWLFFTKRSIGYPGVIEDERALEILDIATVVDELTPEDPELEELWNSFLALNRRYLELNNLE